MKCPHCGSKYLRRSRLRAWEFLLKLFTRKHPYRCQTCGRRSWLASRHHHRRHHHGPHQPVSAKSAAVPQPDEPDLSAIDDSLRTK
jgi:DNA-directed RNA polymerase subunit RPC12/RpoP